MNPSLSLLSLIFLLPIMKHQRQLQPHWSQTRDYDLSLSKRSCFNKTYLGVSVLNCNFSSPELILAELGLFFLFYQKINELLLTRMVIVNNCILVTNKLQKNICKTSFYCTSIRCGTCWISMLKTVDKRRKIIVLEILLLKSLVDALTVTYSQHVTKKHTSECKSKNRFWLYTHTLIYTLPQYTNLFRPEQTFQVLEV